MPETVLAVLDTELGAVRCRLDARRVPHAAALFVGLAQGRARWRTPDGELTSRPLYRALIFHRRIPGALVQSGCPRGDGTGHPGYRIPVEASPGDRRRLEQPGALMLARYTSPPNRADPHPPPAGHVIGSQFGVGLTSMAHLAGQVTVLGRCDDLDIVARLAAVPRSAPAPTLRDVVVSLPIHEGAGDEP